MIQNQGISISHNCGNRKRSLLVPLATLVYLVALYSLMTSFYVFEIRKTQLQTNWKRIEELSTQKKIGKVLDTSDIKHKAGITGSFADDEAYGCEYRPENPAVCVITV